MASTTIAEPETGRWSGRIMLTLFTSAGEEIACRVSSNFLITFGSSVVSRTRRREKEVEKSCKDCRFLERGGGWGRGGVDTFCVEK